MAQRGYRMNERAKAQDETRERIVQATMQLHDEQGVALTSFADVAKRAAIGVATVYRHFATPGALVMACGAHVWAEMAPPLSDHAPAAFAGLGTLEKRLQRLVDELDAFYRRGALRLDRAATDRDRVPELDGFLCSVEAGVSAWVREAVKNQGLPEPAIQLLMALTDFPVWQSMQRIGIDDADRNRLMVQVLSWALAAAR